MISTLCVRDNWLFDITVITCSLYVMTKAIKKQNYIFKQAERVKHQLSTTTDEKCTP